MESLALFVAATAPLSLSVLLFLSSSLSLLSLVTISATTLSAGKTNVTETLLTALWRQTTRTMGARSAMVRRCTKEVAWLLSSLRLSVWTRTM